MLEKNEEFTYSVGKNEKNLNNHAQQNISAEKSISTADKVRKIITAYKQNFARVNQDERYKWEAVGWYKEHWNINADNFPQMLSDSFSKTLNLLAANMYYPYKMLLQYAKENPEAVRALFRMLYDEHIPLAKRYTDFRAGFDQYVKPLSLNHYQDLHAISVYLFFEYPETYYIYKFSIYKKFCDNVDFIEDKGKIKSVVWKIENNQRLCDRVLALVKEDHELLKLSKARLDKVCYQDEAHHLLATDIVYYGSSFNKNEAQSESVYWPSLDEYDPGITKETWTSLLNDRSITTTENLAMLKMMLEQGGESTCASLAKTYGVHNYYNRLGSGYGEKVKKKLNCPDCLKDGIIRYFPIPFVGRYVMEDGKKHYAWKLRNELKEALMDMNLSKIQVLPEESPVTDIGKNTILYGPPGTGKTYITVTYAVAIIENKTLSAVEQEDYDDVLDRYRKYKSLGHIEFTTFHQSYGYEEFIEGIKPIIISEDSDQEDIGDIQYGIVSGIFKRFCEKAEQPAVKGKTDDKINDNPNIWKVSLEGTGDNPTRTECLQNNHIRIGWDSYGKDITDETDFSSDGGKKVINAFINRMQIGDLVLSCYSASIIDAIGVVTGEYEWHNEYAHYKRLRKVNWIVKNIRENILDITNGTSMTLASVYRLASISLSDIIPIIEKYQPAQTVSAGRKKNYVFIIDEINRGNISKIFGELITLIEPSKRNGQPEGISVKLPYSQKLFGVPDNVYLIGTMNTADRSIAAIDTALRRRFYFKEMQPMPEVLADINVEDISILDLLSRINKRISVLYDREHMIGHAYFMPLKNSPTIDTLAEIFANNIIPLLQEYFYEDYEKIRLVLGDNKKQNEEDQFIIAKSTDYAELFGDIDHDFDETNSYEINTAAFDNIEAYRSI